MTPNQRHLANCFEISATRFPGGGDTNGRDAGGDLAARYIKMSIVDGSLLNLLDAIADSQSTEVPYRVGGKPIQSLLCLW